MIRSANGKKGCLIYTGNKYLIRIYEGETFKDYEIQHSDMGIIIDDEDCYLYENGDKMVIDHASSTLGKCSTCGLELGYTFNYKCKLKSCPLGLDYHEI